MKLNSFESVKQLTENMVAIPSINKEPGGESAVARYMQDFYMSLPYFQSHPEQERLCGAAQYAGLCEGHQGQF